MIGPMYWKKKKYPHEKYNNIMIPMTPTTLFSKGASNHYFHSFKTRDMKKKTKKNKKMGSPSSVDYKYSIGLQAV